MPVDQTLHECHPKPKHLGSKVSAGKIEGWTALYPQIKKLK